MPFRTGYSSSALSLVLKSLHLIKPGSLIHRTCRRICLLPLQARLLALPTCLMAAVCLQVLKGLPVRMTRAYTTGWGQECPCPVNCSIASLHPFYITNKTTMVTCTTQISAVPVQQLLETISLYLHIPFCHTRCHYCDFNTYAGILPLREPYVQALQVEIEQAGKLARLPDGTARRARTIFFGGGAPSLLSATQTSRLLRACRSAFAVDKDAEITLEANPGTLTQDQLEGLRAAGINRLSMGAQSFDAGLLKTLGRIHSPQEITQAVQFARAAGFTALNLDFMFGLPGQTMQHWRETLDRALDLHPDHFSLYSLIIEEGTPFYTWTQEGSIVPGDEDLCADMYEYADELLQRAGYVNYEISNWSLPGQHSRHNLTYWQNLPYIGMGAGAYSSFGGRRF